MFPTVLPIKNLKLVTTLSNEIQYKRWIKNAALQSYLFYVFLDTVIVVLAEEYIYYCS